MHAEHRASRRDTALLSAARLTELRERVIALQTKRRATTTSILPGNQPSHLRGFGVELVDNRAYAAGDDVRLMDWRATARTMRPIMKVFRSEKQRTVTLFVDRSATMAFGTRVCTKAAMAAQCAACIAFAAQAQHDPVSATTAEASLQHFAAGRQLDAVVEMLLAIAAPLPTPGGGDDQRTVATPVLLEQLARRSAKDATVFMLSDFRDWESAARGALNELARRRAVVAIRVGDPAETSLPDAGTLRMADMGNGTRHLIDTSNPALREAFRRHISKRRRQQDSLFAGAGVRVIDIQTHQDPVEVLAPWL